MPFLKKICMGTLVLIALSLFSCKKDKEIQPIKITETSVTTNPPTAKTISTGPVIIKTLLVGEKEADEVIKMTELLHQLIKESLTQLLYNHDFNFFMPQVDTREDCDDMSCNAARINSCGCPFQTTSTGDYPKIVTLNYYDPLSSTECSCELPTVNASSDGLKVYGDLEIRFSDAFTSNDLYITIYPKDNFSVDGYDIDADSIRIYSNQSQLTNPVTYEVLNIENVKVTNPEGDITEAVFVGTSGSASTNGNKSTITITDVNNNHGNSDLAFGLLDDKTELTLVDLTILCSNGEQVMANSNDNEPLVYDFACDNIQDGIVTLTQPSLFPGPATEVFEYDYGSPAEGTESGVCDDIIEKTPLPRTVD